MHPPQQVHTITSAPSTLTTWVSLISLPQAHVPGLVLTAPQSQDLPQAQRSSRSCRPPSAAAAGAACNSAAVSARAVSKSRAIRIGRHWYQCYAVELDGELYVLPNT